MAWSLKRCQLTAYGSNGQLWYVFCWLSVAALASSSPEAKPGASLGPQVGPEQIAAELPPRPSKELLKQVRRLFELDQESTPLYVPLFEDEAQLPVRKLARGRPTWRMGRLAVVDTYMGSVEPEEVATKLFVFRRGKEKPAELTYRSLVSRKSKQRKLNSASWSLKSHYHHFSLLKLLASGFDPSLRTVIIIPGFLTDDLAEWTLNIKNSWLALEDVNVVIVGWACANRFFYSRAAASLPAVARQISIFLYYLAAVHGVSLDDKRFLKRITIVGHSLGAHIAGFVGQDFGGRIGRITGLDPAGPFFEEVGPDLRLDPGDALLVDVFHTNMGHMQYSHLAAGGLMQAMGGLLSAVPLFGRMLDSLKDKFSNEGDTAWFGIDSNVGHIDYFVNDGRVQPGCQGLLHVCDHTRITELYTSMLDRELLISRALRDDTSRHWRRENTRLVAFKSNTYQDFLAGKGLSDCCEELVDDTELVPADDFDLNLPSQPSQRSSPSKSCQQCFLPLDPVKPVEWLRHELRKHYNVSFAQTDQSKAPNTRYYFKTLDQKPYLGEHFLVRLSLKKPVLWKDSCSLKVIIEMANGKQTQIIVNKQLYYIDRESFFGVAMPFVHPVGFKATVEYNDLLSTRNEGLKDKLSAQIAQYTDDILPAKIDVSISSAMAQSIGEIFRLNKMSSSAYQGNCKLTIGQLEVRPILSYSKPLDGQYRVRLKTSLNTPVQVATGQTVHYERANPAWRVD